MKPTIDTYPVFDANQVLTNDHLNTVVNYLDEQERLTRANLIGIGIPCGLALTVRSASGSVAFTRGCAVTSLGYLIVEPDDVTLTRRRTYKLPAGDAYAPFMKGDAQIPLWELFADGEPDTTPLAGPAGFLDDKAVLLFLEQDDENLADCSPNNCDDKGSEVTVTVRRLLVSVADLALIEAGLESGSTDAARLALPDLHLRRYDVPRTNLVSTRDVLQAFRDTVRKDRLVSRLEQALLAAYSAFRPILLADHPTNPFNGFKLRFAFLESEPETTRQVMFLPYYMDLVADLIAAYDEFRCRGLALACECCPSANRFPRHVVLGPTHRTGWYPSSASCCGCETLRAEVVLLFGRLVEMTRRFTDHPALAKVSAEGKLDEQIGVTPSRSGVVALSEKSIPYYFDFAGSQPLYRVWNPRLTGLARANQNLAYRSYEYSPAAPAFVRAPLSFDLEDFNFFRIEGHLGKDYRTVLETLATLRESYRLPFDVVAVRTGQLDEKLAVDPREHECRFQDLEAEYRVLGAELSCVVRKAIEALGRSKLQPGTISPPGPLPFASRALAGPVSIPLAATTSLLGRSFADIERDFAFDLGTMGSVFVQNVRDWGLQVVTLPSESAAMNAALSALARLAHFTTILGQDLRVVDWDDFEQTWQALRDLSEAIARAGDTAQTGDGLTWQELGSQIGSVVYACRIDGFRALRAEYERRLLEIRRLAYFSSYAQQHPALQHKAGVPVGGTFVIVYHEEVGLAQDKPRDVFEAAIGQLAGGTVIADFCLPYLCCSDCAPIQYVFAPAADAPKVLPPAITVTTGCTDAKSRADVRIEVTGGTAPYALSVGDQKLPPSTGTALLRLAPGTYTVLVTDAAQIAGSPFTLKVPDPLVAGPVGYQDDTAVGTYTASFPVSGGTVPYTPSAGEFTDGVVTLTGLKSGPGPSVVITDAAGCSTSVTIDHTVEKLCDKPCKGKAQRVRYPAWAPRPAKTSPYHYAALRTWKLTVTDDSGKPLFSDDLAKIVTAVIKGETTITEDTYAAVMSNVCREVSKAVAARLKESSAGRTWVIEYDAKLGTLVIESYVCYSFVIDVDSTLVTEGEKLGRTERWNFTPEGVRVGQQSPGGVISYSMPSFGRIGLDKCAGKPEGTDCAVDVKSIVPAKSGDGLKLSVVFGDGVHPDELEFYWRVDTPSLFFGTKPELPIPVAGAAALHVQLLVVNKKTGCWSFGETTFAAGRTQPMRFMPRP